jgi:hypothetical protein
MGVSVELYGGIPMKKLIILYLLTVLFLGANLYYCMVKVEQLTDASKAAWYELEQHRSRLDRVDGK